MVKKSTRKKSGKNRKRSKRIKKEGGNFWKIIPVIMLAAFIGSALVYIFMYEAPGSKAVQDSTPDKKQAIKETESMPQKDMMKVKLYYYNWKKEKENSEIVEQEPEELLDYVIREIPKTMTPIQDTIRYLLIGLLTEKETAAGFFTELPALGFEIMGASLSGGILTLRFSDPNYFSRGGSQQVALLKAQIEETAKQFKGVKEVRYLPETLFQP